MIPVSCIQISGTIVYTQANQSVGEPLELILILNWGESNFTWHSYVMQAKAVSVMYVTQLKDPLIYYEANGHFFS